MLPSPIYNSNLTKLAGIKWLTQTKDYDCRLVPQKFANEQNKEFPWEC